MLFRSEADSKVPEFSLEVPNGSQAIGNSFSSKHQEMEPKESLELADDVKDEELPVDSLLGGSHDDLELVLNRFSRDIREMLDEADIETRQVVLY